MNISKTMLLALLLLGVCVITACSPGDTPPVTTMGPTPSPPVLAANAGPDQSVFVNTFVTLNGSKSFSAKGTALTYRWSLRKPAGSTAFLSDPSAVNPTLTVDIDGTYEATLIVKDGTLSSAPDTVLIVVGATNVPPAVVLAAVPPVVFKRPVTLDGTGSNDANHDLLIFKWEIVTPNGPLPSNQLLLGDTAAPIFTPDVEGLYTIRLVVSDGTLFSDRAEITISAQNIPPPIADAGLEQSVPPIRNVPTVVTLSGSGTTTPLGETLLYGWVIDPQPNSPSPIAQSRLDTPTPTFTIAANQSGVYVATLTVTQPNHPDPTRMTAMDEVLIRVLPKADAGLDQIVKAGSTVQLDGTASIGTGPIYSWCIIHTPLPGSLPLPPICPFSTLPNPTFVASALGTYTATLTVTDALGNQHSDSVTVQAKSGPIINSVSMNPAFISPFTQTPTQVTVSGTSSPNWAFPIGTFVKPNSSITAMASFSGITGTPSCQWTAVNPAVTFTSQPPCTAFSATATFSASQAGSYNITLNVTDTFSGETLSSPQTFSVRVTTPPTVTLFTPNGSPGVCTKATVNAAVTAGSNPLAPPYSWNITTPTQSRNGMSYTSQVMTPTLPLAANSSGFLSFSNPAIFTPVDSEPTPSATFMPDLPAPFTVTLTVADSLGVSTQSSTTLTSPALTDANLLLTKRNNSCGNCHAITMWNVGGGNGAPDHSAKGLQLFFKYDAGGTSQSNHKSGTPLPATRENLCALFQDFTQP